MLEFSIYQKLSLTNHNHNTLSSHRNRGHNSFSRIFNSFCRKLYSWKAELLILSSCSADQWPKSSFTLDFSKFLFFNSGFDSDSRNFDKGLREKHSKIFFPSIIGKLLDRIPKTAVTFCTVFRWVIPQRHDQLSNFYFGIILCFRKQFKIRLIKVSFCGSTGPSDSFECGFFLQLRRDKRLPIEKSEGITSWKLSV